MNESLVKYLAGLLDADGSLSFNFSTAGAAPDRRFVKLALKLSSSDAIDKKGFVESLPTLTGMGTAYRESARPQFASWTVAKRADLEMLLPRLIKHMVIKAQHWSWILETWRTLRTDSKTVSVNEMEILKESSKVSRRSVVGPMKPKNHPTWAWLAGYLDGDGWFRLKLEKSKSWTVHVGAVAHLNDMSVLRFLETAFGGAIYNQGQAKDVFIWRRALGDKNRSFALSFLPNLAKHSRLKKHKIEAIIHHHRQRLSDQGATA